jgi:spore germination cell wall hydrolase CwlJ-like protein
MRQLQVPKLATRPYKTDNILPFVTALIVVSLVWGYKLSQVADERDYLIRTIAFEACSETELGKVAVAYAVLNRKKSGRWGDGIQAVVTAPGQFEPWMTRRSEIKRLSPTDPCYQSAAAIADAVLSGRAPDPTAGATHFLNPEIVRARRNGSLPSWARGQGHSIGRHIFYYSDRGGASP